MTKGWVLSQQFLNLFPQLFRLRGRRMPRYDLSFAVHQEFGEIPFDPAAEQAGLFFLQMLEDWVRRVAVDVDLRHQRKDDIIGQRTEIRDLVGIARFLRDRKSTRLNSSH